MDTENAERINVTREDAERAVELLLLYMGEDIARPGLQETPARVVRMLEIFRRGQSSPKLTDFDGVPYDEMVLVRGISFASLCEHHMLPFIGTATVAYIPAPDGKVIGLSKLARLVVWKARRLQVQEQLTNEIAQALKEATHAPSVAVRLSAEHLCMSIRGIEKPGHETITTALVGAFRDDPKTRSEFLSQV